MKRQSTKLPLALALVLAAWLVGILFPLAWFSRVNPFLSAWFDRTFASGWTHVAMHAALYAVLVLIVLALARRRGYRMPTLFSAVDLAVGVTVPVACLQEGLQLLPLGRRFGWPEVYDILVDLAAALIAAALYQLWHARQRLLEREEYPND
jgi:hypothetical protein